LIAALAGTRCSREPASDGTNKPPGSAAQQSAPITNRVDIPDTVRRNLGLTFAKVESRSVAETIRVPGRFEYLPDARREYRTMLAGRVELLVKQFQPVEPGAVLYRLDSPPWRELQQKLAEIEAQVREGEKRVEMIGPMFEAHERHHKAVEETVQLLTERSKRLEKGGTEGSVSAEEIGQARAALAQARADLAEVMEKETELKVQRVEVTSQLEAARVRFELLLNNAATLLDLDTTKLLASAGTAPNSKPVWRAREHVEVYAGAPGFVDSIALTNGAWAAETSLVLTTVQPEMIRFHAHAMQSDIGRFETGQSARIVPPKSDTVRLQETMEGQLEVGLSGDPEQRTVDLYLTPSNLARWARPGVTGHLEVVVGGGTSELAIPVSAVIQDGLSSVLFRRDPTNLDKVIRIADADLGVSDGRWVSIRSGVKEGDEVVLNGLYQLMVATSGSIQKGGHFHADGTFHEGDQ
jgi:multidrug resistance efflux pump